MPAQQVVPGLYLINLGFVNAYLLEGKDGLILVDTGVPGSAEKILDAVRSLGKQPADVKHILVTHLHGDHTGSLAALKQATGAPAYMHPMDAALVRRGESSRPVQPAPGLFNKLMSAMMARRGPMPIEPAETEHELHDDQELDVVDGLRVLHAPGHAAGQVVFLWPRHGGVLIAADTCGNMMGFGLPPIFEDLNDGMKTLKKLGALNFEVAVFGHGKPLTSGAAKKFNQKWG